MWKWREVVFGQSWTLPATTRCGDNDVCMTSTSDNSREEHVPGGPLVSAAPLSQSPIDQALDAVVVENYLPTALVVDYPYGPGVQSNHTPSPIQYQPASGLAALFHYQAPAPAQYMVPRRFGMSAILGIMTALAILFGCFRMLNAEPVVYLFFGMQTLVICFAQMLNSKSPRLASSIAGAILVPLFLLPMFFLNGRHWDSGRFLLVTISLAFSIPIGAFLGYLTGTCAAGIFLVMDFLEPYLQGRSRSARSVGL